MTGIWVLGMNMRNRSPSLRPGGIVARSLVLELIYHMARILLDLLLLSHRMSQIGTTLFTHFSLAGVSTKTHHGDSVSAALKNDRSHLCVWRVGTVHNIFIRGHWEDNTCA